MKKEIKRYFQWIAGSRRGEVMIFKKIEKEDDMVFVSFMDNSRCNEDLILPINKRNSGNMLMVEVENPNNIWVFKEEWVGREEEKWETNQDGNKVCVQPFVQGRKKVMQIPPKKSKAKFGEIQPNPELKTPSLKEDHLNDPVWITLEKSKKIDTEISMNLIISLPSKSLFNVMKESFEDGAKKSIKYIINNIDNTKIKEGLEQALFKAYEDKVENKLEEPKF